jgi:uncharacterized protein YcfJ
LEFREEEQAMNHLKTNLVAVSVAIVLSACAATPMGPTIQVMPAPGKAFSLFQEDQVVCKQYAAQEVSGQAQHANEKAAGAALLGTVLGAGLGAAIGQGGTGAAIGAAGGATAGTGVGMVSSSKTQDSIQTQYNNAYAQCMYAKGNQVPGFKMRSTPPK